MDQLTWCTSSPPDPHPTAPPPSQWPEGEAHTPSLSPSHQRCPSFLWCLLQDLQQQVAEGLGDAAVAARRQVEEVKHVLWDDSPVRVDQVPAYVQELSLLAQSRQPGAHQPIDSHVLLPQQVGTLTSGQQTLQGNRPTIENLYLPFRRYHRQ